MPQPARVRLTRAAHGAARSRSPRRLWQLASFPSRTNCCERRFSRTPTSQSYRRFLYGVTPVYSAEFRVRHRPNCVDSMFVNSKSPARPAACTILPPSLQPTRMRRVLSPLMPPDQLLFEETKRGHGRLRLSEASNRKMIDALCKQLLSVFRPRLPL